VIKSGTRETTSLSTGNLLTIAGLCVTVSIAVVGGTWHLVSSIKSNMRAEFVDLRDSMTRQITKLESTLVEHQKEIQSLDVRMTRGEAGAFTGQQAGELSSAVTRLSVEMLAQQKSAEEHRKWQNDVNQKLDRAISQLGPVAPADVFKKFEKVESDLKRVEAIAAAIQGELETIKQRLNDGA